MDGVLTYAGVVVVALAVAGSVAGIGVAGRVAGAVESPRVRFTINEDWSFAFGDGDSAHVDLPHTWNGEDAFTEQTSYRRGVGWYRKQLALSSALQGKRIFLYFEGANQVVDVFVNGDSVGRHVGGYTAFAFDITNRVRFDSANALD